MSSGVHFEVFNCDYCVTSLSGLLTTNLISIINVVFLFIFVCVIRLIDKEKDRC